MADEVFTGSIFIEAPPEEVFVFFTDAAALASWMGDRAVVEPRPGGRFIVVFDDRVVEGRYVEVEFPRRVVVTWGRHGSTRMPPGRSTLAVTFTAEAAGTRVDVRHDGLPGVEGKLHADGWAHYLPRLAAAAAGTPVTAHVVPLHLTADAD